MSNEGERNKEENNLNNNYGELNSPVQKGVQWSEAVIKKNNKISKSNTVSINNSWVTKVHKEICPFLCLVCGLS